MFRKPYYTILSGIIAIAFTVYIALDTFVLAQVYTKVDNNPTNSSVDETAKESAVISEDSYKDDNISIKLTTYREYDTDIYVADVTVSSPELIKTALAKSSYGKNVTDKTSNIANECGAILAVNGDFYGVQEEGYVIRNGVLYRESSKGYQEDLVIYKDGSFEIINEDEVSADKLMEDGAYNVLSFGPGLIKSGEIAVTTSDEVAVASASNPRTAIGIIDDLHYVFVVADGRTSASAGLSLYELATFMQTLNVETAYNLDGGGSSTMVFNGNIINNPSSKANKNANHKGNERSVSDIVYIGY